MSRIIEAFSQFFDGNGDPLSGGKLKFTESGSTSTLKTTYSDSGETTPNTNPVILDGEGRCGDVFGTGSYRIYSYNSADVQIQVFDPVGGSIGVSDFDDWSSSNSYSIGDIVVGSNDNYYSSLTAANENNDPISDAVNWKEIAFTQYWNTNITYAQYNVVVLKSSGVQYVALQAGTGKDPASEVAYWDITGVKLIDETAPGLSTSLDLNENAIIYNTAGGSVTAAELGNIDGLTAEAAELNKLDGLATTKTELGYVAGATSNIQDQITALSAGINGWVNFDGTSTGAIDVTNSVNVLSVTDHGTGDYEPTWDTNFASSGYGTTFGGARHAGSGKLPAIGVHTKAVGSVRIEVEENGTPQNIDITDISVVAIGDLV